MHRRQRELADAIIRFIHLGGGHVVSVPGSATIRFEVKPNSELPGKLAQLGYKIFPIGQTTRFDPIGKVETCREKGTLRERKTGDFVRFDRFEFTLLQSLPAAR